jgi:hypothetical protein
MMPIAAARGVIERTSVTLVRSRWCFRLKPARRAPEDMSVNSLTITWMVAGIAACAVVVIMLRTFVGHAAGERSGHRKGTQWKRAYHLGGELASGRGVDDNGKRLVELIDDADDPILVASALAVVVRQSPVAVDFAFFRAVRRSRLGDLLLDRMHGSDVHTTIEALELIEVLRIHELLGEAATLTYSPSPLVARAATDAVVALDPSIGLGILVGLARSGESWVFDSVGRAITALNERGADLIPLSQPAWRHQPMLASRALAESATFDRATVTDAISTLIGAIDSPSPSTRLAAVNALSGSIDNPAAQLALAGALGSTDRMTRYAAAAALSDSVTGRMILRRAAADADGSDAARMATEILWTVDHAPEDAEQLAAS